MARYKWDSAYEWLREKAEGWSSEELFSALLDFAQDAGSDAIQDRYQDEMEDDGFFRDLDICSKLSRESCVSLLEGVSIECRDDETVEELREAVESNLEDGTLEYSDVEAEAR